MSRTFRVIWQATGEEFEAWPNTSGFGFARAGEMPFRSLPADQFWQVFCRADEKPEPGNMQLF